MASNRLQNIQVLIVDDEKTINRLVYDVLMELGFRFVTIANSGRKAIELVTKQPFDFIITDWRMGDLDGIDLIRFVRMSPESSNPRLPIILLTGNTEAHYVLTARDAGVNEYILKPFSAEQLVKRIRSIIERPRPFVEAPTYRGPERRYHDAPPPNGIDRRKKKSK
jgi:DNA-binding response OmpR family regulator